METNYLKPLSCLFCALLLFFLSFSQIEISAQSFPQPEFQTQVKIKTFLQGPYNVVLNKMRTDLIDLDSFPARQPYSAIPWD